MYVLVNEPMDVLFTIRRVPLREKLMGMPYKVNIQRRYEKRRRGRRHQIQEAIRNREGWISFRSGIRTLTRDISPSHVGVPIHPLLCQNSQHASNRDHTFFERTILASRPMAIQLNHDDSSNESKDRHTAPTSSTEYNLSSL